MTTTTHFLNMRIRPKWRGVSAIQEDNDNDYLWCGLSGPLHPHGHFHRRIARQGDWGTGQRRWRRYRHGPAHSHRQLPEETWPVQHGIGAGHQVLERRL